MQMYLTHRGGGEAVALQGVIDRSEREEVNEGEISVMEIEKAIKRTKSGKSAGVDGCVIEGVKAGGRVAIEWLLRLFNVCFLVGSVPSDWCRACMIPLYKGKGEVYDCKNSRGISLLSVVGKLYGRVLIERVRRLTEELVGEEQGGFRRGRGCVDQLFVLRQLNEKFMEMGKKLYWAFMDLEKAYDRVNRDVLWGVLESYGVYGKLLGAVKSMYVESKACVRVGGDE